MCGNPGLKNRTIEHFNTNLTGHKTLQHFFNGVKTIFPIRFPCFTEFYYQRTLILCTVHTTQLNDKPKIFELLLPRTLFPLIDFPTLFYFFPYKIATNSPPIYSNMKQPRHRK